MDYNNHRQGQSCENCTSPKTAHYLPKGDEPLECVESIGISPSVQRRPSGTSELLPFVDDQNADDKEHTNTAVGCGYSDPATSSKPQDQRERTESSSTDSADAIQDCFRKRQGSKEVDTGSEEVKEPGSEASPRKSPVSPRSDKRNSTRRSSEKNPISPRSQRRSSNKSEPGEKRRSRKSDTMSSSISMAESID